MKRKTLLHCVAGLAGLALASSSALAQNQNSNEQSQETPDATQDTQQNNQNTSISRSQAEQTAKSKVPGGQVESGTLERQGNGQEVWIISVYSPNSQKTSEVSVDAENGNVVAINQENMPTTSSHQGVGSGQIQERENQQQAGDGNPTEAPSGSQQYAAQQYNQQEYGRGFGSSQWAQAGRFCDAKRLMGEELNDRHGRAVGHIKDVVLNTQGQTLLVVSLGNSKDTLVPVQALNITGPQSNPQLTLNTSRQKLEQAPQVQNGQCLQALRNPDFTQRIYSRYNLQLQPNEEVGVLIVTPIPEGAQGGSYYGQGGSQQGQGYQPGENNWQQQGNQRPLDQGGTQQGQGWQGQGTDQGPNNWQQQGNQRPLDQTK